MTTPQGWQPSIKDLEQLAEQAKQREGRILVAINAARAVAWIDNYLPAKAAPEDRFSIEISMRPPTTHDEHLVESLLMEAAKTMAPEIIDKAYEIARERIGAAQ